MMEEFLQRIPSHSAMLSLHVRELKKQDLETKAAIAKADAHFSRNFMRGYREREQACYAFYLITLDRIDEAQSVLSNKNIKFEIKKFDFGTKSSDWEALKIDKRKRIIDLIAYEPNIV